MPLTEFEKKGYTGINQRARLQHALELTLEGMGVDPYIINFVILHAKEHADFIPLKAAISKHKKGDKS